MRKLAKMSGDVRERGWFTFQSGREIQYKRVVSDNVSRFDTVQKQSIHPALYVSQSLWRNNSFISEILFLVILVELKYYCSVIFPIDT